MPSKRGTKEEKLREIVFICTVSTDLQVRTAICKFGSGTVRFPIGWCTKGGFWLRLTLKEVHFLEGVTKAGGFGRG